MKCKQTRNALWKRTSLTVFALTLSASLAFAGSPKIVQRPTGAEWL